MGCPWSLHWIPKKKDLESFCVALIVVSIGGKCNRKGFEVKCTNMLLGPKGGPWCVCVCVCVYTCPYTQQCVSGREMEVILDFRSVSWAVLWCPALSPSFPAPKPLPRHPSCTTHLPRAQDHVFSLISRSRSTHVLPFIMTLLTQTSLAILTFLCSERW